MSYTISSVRTTPRGHIVYDVVTDQLQRVHVTVPRVNTDAATVDAVITHALAGLVWKARPVR